MGKMVFPKISCLSCLNRQCNIIYKIIKIQAMMRMKVYRKNQSVQNLEECFWMAV